MHRISRSPVARIWLSHFPQYPLEEQARRYVIFSGGQTFYIDRWHIIKGVQTDFAVRKIKKKFRKFIRFSQIQFGDQNEIQILWLFLLNLILLFYVYEYVMILCESAFFDSWWLGGTHTQHSYPFHVSCPLSLCFLKIFHEGQCPRHFLWGGGANADSAPPRSDATVEEQVLSTHKAVSYLQRLLRGP